MSAQRLPPTLVRLASLPGAVVLGFVVNLAAGARLPETLASATGKTVALWITDAGLRLCFEISGRGLRARPDPVSPDVCICACAADFASLARREADPDTLFFSRRLKIEGDTELGVAVKNTLDALPAPGLHDLAPLKVFGALRASLFG